MCQPPARQNFPVASKVQERGQRSARLKRREGADGERRDTTTNVNGGMQTHCFYARKELMKLGVNKPGPGRQAQLQIVRYTTSKLRAGDRQWCLRKRGSDCISSLWQDNVNAAVVIAWQIPPFCNWQAARPTCMMGPRDSRTRFLRKTQR